MTPKDRTTPSDPEISDQLEIILNSAAFSNHSRPSAVLRFIVETTLARNKQRRHNSPITERDIAEALFPATDYAPGSNVARVHAVSMRQLLAEYNQTIGKDDPIIIAFPRSTTEKGKKRSSNYKPEFTYNPANETSAKYLSALYHIGRATPQDLEIAADHLGYILQDPTYFHFSANLTWIDVCAASSFFEYLIFRVSVTDAYNRLDTLLEMAPKDWRVQAVAGTLAMAHRDIPQAALHYAEAYAANPSEIRKYRWYQVFLLAVERTTEALELISANVTADPTNPLNHALLGLTFYGLRRFDEAHSAFEAAIWLNNLFPLAQLGMAMTEIAMNMPMRALHIHLPILETPVNGLRWFMYGLTFLCACSPPFEEAPAEFQDELLEEFNRRVAALKYWKEEYDPEIHCVFQKALTHTLKHDVGFVVEYAPWMEFQAAILQLCINNDEDAAVAALEAAWANSRPLIAWLHMMPIFDILRGHQGFLSLEQRRLEPAAT